MTVMYFQLKGIHQFVNNFSGRSIYVHCWYKNAEFSRGFPIRGRKRYFVQPVFIMPLSSHFPFCSVGLSQTWGKKQRKI